MARGQWIEIDGSSAVAMANAIGATEKQLEAALRSTYSRMGRWLRTRSVRGLAGVLQIQQRILRARIKSFRLQGGVGHAGNGAKVWFGLRPIALIRLNARQSGNGVSAAGGRHVDGAFIANYHGRRQVLRRKGKERLPVEIVTADIDDQSVAYIEDNLIGTDEFDTQFFKFLEHELKWRTQILK